MEMRHTLDLGGFENRCAHTLARRLVATCTVIVLALGAAGELVPARAQGSTAYRDAVLSERGLVSYWRADERKGASRALDSKGANRGAYRNRPQLHVAGLVRTSANTAARYDGENDSIRVPDDRSLDLRSAFTLEAWVKPRSLRRSATIVRKDRAYLLKAEGRSVRLTFWDRAGRRRTLVARRRLAAGRRHHVVGTYRAGKLRLYVDGRRVARSRLRARFKLRTSARPLTIGSYGGQAFAGVIDETAVYRTALRGAAVAAHHRAAMRVAAGPPAPAPVPAPRPAPPAAAPAPSGTVLWNGDFDTGGFGPYQMLQAAAADRIALVG